MHPNKDHLLVLVLHRNVDHHHVHHSLYVCLEYQLLPQVLQDLFVEEQKVWPDT